MDWKRNDRCYWQQSGGEKIPGHVESVREDGRVLFVTLPGGSMVAALAREVTPRPLFEVVQVLEVTV